MINHINELLPIIAEEHNEPTSNHVFQISCIAHTLQLAVKEGLKQCKTMDDAIGTFRDLLKKILDSPK